LQDEESLEKEISAGTAREPLQQERIASEASRLDDPRNRLEVAVEIVAELEPRVGHGAEIEESEYPANRECRGVAHPRAQPRPQGAAVDREPREPDGLQAQHGRQRDAAGEVQEAADKNEDTQPRRDGFGDRAWLGGTKGAPHEETDAGK
jgi:hypothetical protein